MPPIPKFRAKITPQPVGTAPLPVGAADIGAGAIGQGLQAIGRGVSDIGNTLFQIKREQIALNDAINMTKANAFITAEEKTFEQYMSENDPGIKADGSPNDWEIEREKSWTKLTANVEGLEFSPKSRAIMTAKLDAYGELRDVNIRTTISELKKQQAEAFVITNLEKAIQTGDPIRIADAKGVFKSNAASIWGGDKATAQALFDKAVADGTKEFYIDQSKLFPDNTIAEMQAKRNALGKSGKDEDGLGAKDYDDIIASSHNAKDLRKKALDVQQQQELEELSQELVDGTIDWSKIKSKESLTAEQKESYRLKMNAEAKRKAGGILIATDQRVKRELEEMAYDLTSGAVSIQEFKIALDEARFPETGNPTINDSTYDSLNTLAEGKFASYQDKAMKERETYALTQLVTLPSEEAFAEMLARITSKFDKQQAQSLRQLQFDNLDQYKHALRGLRAKNPDWDANKIYEEGRSLLTQYRKTPDELRIPGKIRKAVRAGIEIVTALAPIPTKKDFKNQVDSLKIMFNLSDSEVGVVNKWLDEGFTLGEITERLREVLEK